MSPLLGALHVDCLTVTVIFCNHPSIPLQTVIRGAVLAAMSILSLVGNVLTLLAIAKDAGRTPLCTMVLHLRYGIFILCLSGNCLTQ